MNFREKINQNLKSRSIRQLAKDCGIKREQTLQDYLSGKTQNINLIHLINVCNKLDIKFKYELYKIKFNLPINEIFEQLLYYFTENFEALKYVLNLKKDKEFYLSVFKENRNIKISELERIFILFKIA